MFCCPLSLHFFNDSIHGKRFHALFVPKFNLQMLCAHLFLDSCAVPYWQPKWSRPKPIAFRHFDYHVLVLVGLFFQFAQNVMNLCRILVHNSWNKDLLNMLSEEIVILDNNQSNFWGRELQGPLKTMQQNGRNKWGTGPRGVEKSSDRRSIINAWWITNSLWDWNSQGDAKLSFLSRSNWG